MGTSRDVSRRKEVARRALRVLLVTTAFLVPFSKADAQAPTPDFQWNNFVGFGRVWSSANNWVPSTGPVIAPTSNVNRVLGFGSSTLQTQSGYTTTFDQTGSFDLNSLVFTSVGASNPGVIVTGSEGGSSLRFNTSTAANPLAPSIWQNGSGRVLIQSGNALSRIVLNGGTTLGVLGNGIGDVQLTANISETGGAGGLFINQTGTRSFNTGSVVRLGGAELGVGANSFTGGVTLTSGNLYFGRAGALGTGTVTINGGTLQFDPSVPTGSTVSNNMILNSSLVLTSLNNAGVSAPINPIATFSGSLSGIGGININPSSVKPTAVNPPSVNPSSRGIYAFTGANSFTGDVNIGSLGNVTSTLTFGTSTIGTGSASGASSFNVGSNNTLTFDNRATAAIRTSGNAPVVLNRGNLSFIGNATADTSETFGSLTVNGIGQVSASGASTVANTQTLTFSSLNRGAFGTGTLSIVGTNLGSNTGAGESIVRFTSDPGGAIGGGGGSGTTNRSILPYLFVNPSTSNVAINNLARWDATTQKIIPLATSEYSSNLYKNGSGLAPGDNNLRYSSTSSLPTAFGQSGLNTAMSGNSLILDTNTTSPLPRVGVSLSGSGTLTLGSGAILSTVTATNNNASIPSMINLGGLNFGTNPGYIHSAANLTINSPVSGFAGLVKSGFGSLNLMGSNTFSGGLTVNSGTLNFTSDANLGAAGESLILNGGLSGTLNLNPFNLSNAMTTGSVTVNRSITVGPAGGSVGAQMANTNLTLSGNISGAGQLQKVNSGVLILSGVNTGFTGNIALNAGTLAVGSDSSLGSSASGLILGGGTFQATSSFTTNRDVLVTYGTTILTNGNNLTLAGNLTSQSDVVTVTKDGPGDLILTGESTLVGAFQNGTSVPVVLGTNLAASTTSGRTILTGPNGSLPLASSVIALGGGEVVMDNTVNVNSNRIGNVTLGVGGGAVTLRGNAASSVTEAVGAISYAANADAPYGGTLTVEQPTSAGGDQATTLDATSIGESSTSIGTLLVRGTNLGATTGHRTAVILAANPAQSNGLITGLVGATTATGQPTDFLTTRTITVAAPNSNQFSLVPFTSYAPGTGALGAGAAANTYNITGAATFSGTSAANALRISTGGSVNLGGGTLTITGGNILSTGGANSGINNGTLNLGANVARITTAFGSDLTIGAFITGSNNLGLVKSGGGVLTLNTATSITGSTVANPFGGNMVAEGTLRYGVANALPVTAGVFINSGAVLDLNNTTSTVAWARGLGNVNVGNGSLTLGSNTSPTVTFGGSFVGSSSSSLIKSGTSTIEVAGNSSDFSGTVSVLNGTLVTSSNLGIGTGALLLGATSGSNRAQLTLGATVTNFSNPITVQLGSTPGVNANTINGASGISSLASNIAINNTSSTRTSGGYTATGIGLQLAGSAIGINGPDRGAITQTGTISGVGGLDIASGNWNMFGANTYSGGTFIDTSSTNAIGIGNSSIVSGSSITSGPFGTGAVAFSSFGGNLRADGAARTIANQINLSSTGGTFGVAGMNDLTLTGAFDLQSATVVQTLNITNTGSTIISGTIQNGTGGITKIGPGTLVLTGANTYAGLTTLNAGVTLANNTAGNALPSGVTVNSGAVLGGSGSVFGPLTVNAGATVAPGNSPGVLTVNGNTVLTSGSNLDVELQSAILGTGYDQLIVNGTIDLGGSNLIVRLGYAPTPSDFFYIVNNDMSEAITGNFSGLVQGGSVNAIFGGTSYVGSVSYSGNFGTTDFVGAGNDVVLFGLTAVPEPGSLALIGMCGLAMIPMIRRLKRPTL